MASATIEINIAQSVRCRPHVHTDVLRFAVEILRRGFSGYRAPLPLVIDRFLGAIRDRHRVPAAADIAERDGERGHAVSPNCSASPTAVGVSHQRFVMGGRLKMALHRNGNHWRAAAFAAGLAASSGVNASDMNFSPVLACLIQAESL